MKKQQRVLSKDEWIYFAAAYFELASIGFEKIQSTNSDDEIDIFLIVPSLYNLKHGIEIMLKALSIKFLNKDSLDNSDLSHDLKILFEKFKKDVPRDIITNAAKEFLKKNADVDPEDVESDFIFRQLEEIITKYIELEVIKSKITPKDLVLEDLSNSALRYPSNDINVHIHYTEILKRISKSEVYQMSIDCSNARMLLWKLLVLYLNKKS